MLDEILDDLKGSCSKAHESLRRALSKLRTGRANPEFLDSVRVDYYGSLSPLSQLATISVPEPRMLMVKPWDKQNMKAVEKAIIEASLGLNPQNDGEVLRIPMPALTEERRRDIVKMAKKAGEDAKISIRKSRQDARALLDALKADGEASADDIERAMKKVEEIVQTGTADVDAIVTAREKDIMAV